MTNEIRYSYYNHPENLIDTVIIYDSGSTVLIHEHQDEDVGIESIHLDCNVDEALRLVQNALDIIYKEDGWEDLERTKLTEYNTNSLIAWNNALVDSGIIRNMEVLF